MLILLDMNTNMNLCVKTTVFIIMMINGKLILKSS